MSALAQFRLNPQIINSLVMISTLFCNLKDLILRVRIGIAQNYKETITNPAWLFMFVFGRFQIVRYIISYVNKQPLLDKYIANYTLFEGLNVESSVELLKKDGIKFGIKLPKSLVQDILKFASYGKCYANKNTQIIFYINKKNDSEAKYGTSFVVGDYLNAYRLCPAIKKIETDPKLLEIAARYLKAEPICTGTRLWWTFATKAPLDEQSKLTSVVFHYDPIDYLSIKFYFYLTKVDLYSGPHVCVRGSHAKKKLTHKCNLFIGRSDQEIIDYYGIENVLTISGEAGYGFAEDPFCYHKAITPNCIDRLMLQIQFTVNDYQRNRN